MTDLFVLVHAPVLGPASWQPVGAELSRAGHRVAIPSLGGFSADGPPYAPRFVRLCAEQISDTARVSGGAAKSTAEAAQPAQKATGQPAPEPERVVLVLHSGAGPFAGHLAAAVQVAAAQADRVTVVFADAGLPDEYGSAPVVDAGFLPYLREIARNGVVPPWQDWWPGADPGELFPNDAARVAVMTDARPRPLAFFEEKLPPVSDGRPLDDAGYLLFSEGYQTAAAEARQRGWPVAELAGSHLHMMESPAEVAAAIVGLAERVKTP